MLFGDHTWRTSALGIYQEHRCVRNMAKSVGNFLRVSAGGTFSPSGLFGNDAEILGVVLTLGHCPALFQIGNGQSIVPSRSVTADVVALCLSQTC